MTADRFLTLSDITDRMESRTRRSSCVTSGTSRGCLPTGFGMSVTFGRRRVCGTTSGDRRPAGPADRAEGRAAVVDDRVAGRDEHGEADRFLREHDGSGTQRTYAYLLVDHLRWLDRECLAARAGRAAGSGALHGYRRARRSGCRWASRGGSGKRPYGPAALSIDGGLPEGLLPAPGRARVSTRSSARRSTGPGCRRGRTGAGRSWGT